MTQNDTDTWTMLQNHVPKWQKFIQEKISRTEGEISPNLVTLL
jgi:hypothetical protein